MPEPTPEEAQEIQRIGERIEAQQAHKRIFEQILSLENDGQVAAWLETPSERSCQCGMPMARWEALNGRCQQCSSGPEHRTWFARDTCPCGHLSYAGWHLASADPARVLGRCQAYWQQHVVRAKNKKTGERIEVRFRVKPGDRYELERVSTDVVEDYR